MAPLGGRVLMGGCQDLGGERAGLGGGVVGEQAARC